MYFAIYDRYSKPYLSRLPIADDALRRAARSAKSNCQNSARKMRDLSMSTNSLPTAPTHPIEISAWSPDWARQFAIKARAIRSALDEQAVRIDHIGSTAVQGLAAKPIIDIQISVADFESIDLLAARMATIGYLWRASNADLTKRYFRETPGNARTHIHVRRLGSWSEQWSLLFRDYMRAHTHEHAPYERLKRSLAMQYPHDRVSYTDAKSGHLWAIIRRADDWASRTGWQSAPSDV